MEPSLSILICFGNIIQLRNHTDSERLSTIAPLPTQVMAQCGFWNPALASQKKRRSIQSRRDSNIKRPSNVALSPFLRSTMLDTPHCPYTSPTERSSLLVANGRINSISSSISSTDTNRSSPSLSALTSLSRGGHSRTHRKIRSWVWAWQWVSPRSRHRSQWVEDTPKPSRSTFPSDENLELVPATVGPLQLTEIKRRSLLGGIWLAQCLAVSHFYFS